MAISGEDIAGGDNFVKKTKWRLFIGNLSPSVSKEELREKFDLLLKDPSKLLRVGSVEVRCKNGDNYFGFVDIFGGGGGDGGGGGGNNVHVPQQLHKVIDLMNNTKWKGSLIKVQLAKESFLDKLKRERAGEGQGTNSDGDKPKQPTDMEIATSVTSVAPSRPVRRAPFIDRRGPGNFDFEIVATTEKDKTRKTFPGEMGRGDGDGDNSDEEEVEEVHWTGVKKFKGLGSLGLFGQPLLTENDAMFVPTPTPVPGVEEKEKSPAPKPKPKEKEVPSSKEMKISKEEQTRFEKLQRIAGYTALKPTSIYSEAPAQQEFHLHQPSTTTTTPSSPKKGVVFKAHKQQNSDLLRQQSLLKLNETKQKQSLLIKSALSQSNIKNTFNDNDNQMEDDDEEPSSKKAKKTKDKMNIFGDEEDGDDEETFNIKKQYEGAEGQKLLELKSKYGFDQRFNLDKRFQEEQQEEQEEDLVEEQKKQMNILSSVLGTHVDMPLKKKGESSKKPSVLINRYDPDLHQDEEEAAATETSKSSKKSSKKKNKEKEDDGSKKEEPEPEPLIRSTEPASYKTAANLKSLFSSEDTEKESSGGFSLLATFGSSQENEGEKEEQQPSVTGTPRQFWQSNPFKYDSSSDEEEDDDKTSKKKKASLPLTLSKTEGFFFKKNDPRFEGLSNFFLRKDEMVQRIDYDEKRRELRSIVKAKARNAKRKDEKRTLAIKRAIRKKRKYKRAVFKNSGGNAVKLGGS